MRLNLRSRVFVSFVLVIIAFGVVGGVLGAWSINRTTVAEEQRRVNADLRSAWSVIHARFNELSTLASVLGTGKRVLDAFGEPDAQTSRTSLETVRREFNLDMVGLTDDRGRVILRTLDPHRLGDDLSNDAFIAGALRGRAVSGFSVLGPERLRAEGGDLAERAFTAFEATPKAKPRAKESESSGLAVMAAAPVRDARGVVLGTIFAGNLINRNHTLVDLIRSIVFENEVMDGRPVGSVTIFQWDVRVATNVLLPNGNRAVGTRVSAEVYDKVLENNTPWSDRAFVVNDWYISAYDPVRDVEGKVVGILYVGVLAKKFDEIRQNLWKIFGGVSLVCVVLVIGVGTLFARRLTRTVGSLAEASKRLAEGDLSQHVPEPGADDELRDLTRTFNSMAESLKDRDERLHTAREELERANGTLRRVNRNYLDMLGFVSHELKNTLGVVYTSARALDSGLAGPLTEKQAVLTGAVARNIAAAVLMTRHYLDLTRIETGEMRCELKDSDLVADVLAPVLEELREAVAGRGVSVFSALPASVPISCDPALLRVAMKNLLDNALKYGRPGGQVRIGFGREGDFHRLEVWNEGDGVPAGKLPLLFGKFVRLRPEHEAGTTGTGLGLFITKEIVEQHGGVIRAESEEGQWMRIVFTLPAPPEETGGERRKTPDPTAPAAPEPHGP